MSTERRAHLPPSPKGPDGRRLCRWCRRPVQPPRRYWCSDACVEEYRIRSNPSYARQKVWERDRGVCALCGVDTGPLQEELDVLWSSVRWAPPSQAAQERLAALGFPWDPFMPRPHVWEADHIVPVVEGGGETGLDNLRTLCLRCHRRETAMLARRRSTAKRRQNQLDL